MTYGHSKGRRRRCAIGLITSVSVVTLLAACSSAKSSSSGATDEATGSAAASIAPFTQQVSAFEKGSPASFGGPQTAPAIPKNINLWVISCDASDSGCQEPAEDAATAAKFLGWKVTVFNGNSDPTTENAGVLDAIADRANAIILITINPLVIQQGLREAASAGVKVVSVSGGTGSPNPPSAAPKYTPAVDVSVNYPAVGTAVAAAVIANSGGKADVWIQSDKASPVIAITQNAILAELAKCSGCKVEQPIFYFTSDDIATTLGQETVGYLEAHPNVNYIIVPFDPAAVAEVTAIRSAGLANRVKIVSVVGAAQNLNFIRTGDIQFADVAEDSDYLGYAGVDQTIRLLDGAPVITPNNEDAPLALLEKSNLPTDGQEWAPSFNAPAMYEQLWKTGHA